MRDVTAEEVRQAVLNSGVSSIMIRECSICRSPIGFVINGGKLYRDSDCDCTWGRSFPTICSWSDLAYGINIQTADEAKRETAAKFFIDIDQPAPEIRPSVGYFWFEVKGDDGTLITEPRIPDALRDEVLQPFHDMPAAIAACTKAREFDDSAFIGLYKRVDGLAESVCDFTETGAIKTWCVQPS